MICEMKQESNYYRIHCGRTKTKAEIKTDVNYARGNSVSEKGCNVTKNGTGVKT